MVASFHDVPAGQAGLYVGLLASAFALAQLTTNLLWGYMSDIVGRKPVMLAGTFLLAICFGFFGFCTTFSQLIAVHIAMGLLNGNAAVVPTCLGEVTDRSNQSRAFTWLPVMYSIGGITGPALGGLLVRTTAGDEEDNIAFPFLAPNIAGAALLLASVIVLAIWFDETLEMQHHNDNYNKAPAWLRRALSWGCCGLGRSQARGRQGSWSSRWPMSHGRTNNASLEDSVSSDMLPSSIAENEDEDDETSATEHSALLSSTTVVASDSNEDGKLTSGAELEQQTPGRKSAFHQLANHTTLTVLISYLVFQLSNISFNSLYPIFASSPPPTGRDLSPQTIGLSLSFAGLATILFQICVYPPMKARLGNLGTYRAALLGLAVSMALMPWIGYLDDSNDVPALTDIEAMKSTPWLVYIELGVILVIKNACAVGGLSSVMLLVSWMSTLIVFPRGPLLTSNLSQITNSAPSHETLGTLNGIAQTLSAAGRSIGPFLSGGLFTISTRIHPKGEALAWGLFAGVSLIGWLGTLSIKNSNGLESGDWIGDGADDDEEEEDDDDEMDHEEEVHIGEARIVHIGQSTTPTEERESRD
jgi:MFS family permease